MKLADLDHGSTVSYPAVVAAIGVSKAVQDVRQRVRHQPMPVMVRSLRLAVATRGEVEGQPAHHYQPSTFLCDDPGTRTPQGAGLARWRVSDAPESP